MHIQHFLIENFAFFLNVKNFMLACLGSNFLTKLIFFKIDKKDF